ncbi:MAG: HNH endonuclease [Bacteroidota bacterium]|nr:HNH endonuclease [Bacteroidota bacterium]
MSRCTKKSNLEVHHVRRDGGNDLTNAQVLCKDCHSATSTYGNPGKSPTQFTQDVKDKALKRAGNQCECTSVRGCH